MNQLGKTILFKKVATVKPGTFKKWLAGWIFTAIFINDVSMLNFIKGKGFEIKAQLPLCLTSKSYFIDKKQDYKTLSKSI